MDTTAATLFGLLDRELWLVTASAGEKRGGLIATFVSEASIAPDVPRMLVGLAKAHHTCELVEASRAFVLHLLAEEHLELVWRFGLQSGRGVDKFAGLAVQVGECGPRLETTIGWLECRVEASLDIGDRMVYLSEVVGRRVTNFTRPLTQRRMLELAPPDRLAELKRRRDHDSCRDAEVIRAWRQARATGER